MPRESKIYLAVHPDGRCGQYWRNLRNLRRAIKQHPEGAGIAVYSMPRRHWGECRTWDVPTFRIVGDRVI